MGESTRSFTSVHDNIGVFVKKKDYYKMIQNRILEENNNLPLNQLSLKLQKTNEIKVKNQILFE